MSGDAFEFVTFTPLAVEAVEHQNGRDLRVPLHRGRDHDRLKSTQKCLEMYFLMESVRAPC